MTSKTTKTVQNAASAANADGFPHRCPGRGCAICRWQRGHRWRHGRLPDDDDALVRLPGVLAVYPVGASCWHRGVATGKFPKPVKLSARVSAWRVRDIRRLLASVGNDTAP